MPSWRMPRSEAPTPQSDGPRLEKDVEKLAVPFWSLRNRRTVIILVAVGTLLLLLALGLGLGLGLGLKDRCPHDDCSTKNHKGSNVLVIMTDDQDMLLDSMSAMPNVTKLIGGEGVTYQKHYCTVAWCCPSRVNFLTGRAAHNTNVTSTGPPYGGWQKFAEQGLNDKYLPVWISDSGIQTYYIGKLLNGYSKKNLAKPAHPKGWTNSSFLVDPWTYNYYHGHWTNGYTDEVTTFKGIHTTDVTQNKSLAMLEDAANSGEQFFMMVAPVAPHQEIAGKTRPPPVPKAYQGMFAGEQAPRSANWNPDVPSGASWVYGLPKLDEKKIDVCDVTHRHRLGNLAAIDAMVAQLIQKLDDHGILDNTYVVYTTDNGFHIGNHRLQPGKRCPYEEDINIPLLIRGPGVAKGVNSTITNSHTDMAPTILQMLGVPLQDDFDGAPIAYTSEELSSSNKSEMVNVEFWNSGSFTPIGFAQNLYYNNTYKALRLMSGNYSLYYSTWCSGEREFYDMGTDFAQMYNRLSSKPTGNSSTYYGRSESDLFDRLDALLMVTKSCKEETCRVPWSALFPDNTVGILEEAMNPIFDSFFANQPKVQFSSCAEGNIISEEGPQLVNVFSGS